MNFGFSEEQDLLRRTTRTFLEEHAPLSLARRVLESGANHAPELWSRLCELGWAGVGVPEAHGGSGLSEIELCIVVEELGRNLVPVPFLPHAIATAAVLELGSPEQHATLLPELASGAGIGTTSLAPRDRAGTASDDLVVEERDGGFTLCGRLGFVPDAGVAQWFVVQASVRGEASAWVVPRGTQGLEIRPMQALDALRPLSELCFDAVSLPADARLAGSSDVRAGLERVLDRALVLISAEMLGGAERCLETSVEYAKQRVQFGKPIGVHQAIKHKCADMLFAVEAARSITYYAAWALSQRLSDGGVFASMAKATAGDAYRRAAAENLQIHGGIGFTWETACHLYLRRARSDDAWFGSASSHRERIAHSLRFDAADAASPHSG
jgi:alkylation response protein AidB-like acyl-CoA dehydrogenase